jgi:hypothetical protein
MSMMSRAEWNADVIGENFDYIPTLVDDLEYAVYMHRCMARLYNEAAMPVDQACRDFNILNMRKARIALAALYAAGEE